jgi:hypothetical protein
MTLCPHLFFECADDAYAGCPHDRMYTFIEPVMPEGGMPIVVYFQSFVYVAVYLARRSYLCTLWCADAPPGGRGMPPSIQDVQPDCLCLVGDLI